MALARSEFEGHKPRNRIDGSVQATLGQRRLPLRAYSGPAGDPGWFGPESITWKVHSQLGPMLIGGLSALLLQSLHPLVVQGVTDHSNYREDPFGRLRRTADFIASTTYGSDALATEAVRRVRAIHGRIHGVTVDGRPYSASDSALLTYVHVTEVWSFLRAYHRYSQNPLLLDEKNRYLAEMSVVAERLGAREVPNTTDEVRSYLRDVGAELEYGAEAVAVVKFILTAHRSSTFERFAQRMLTEAAMDLMPNVARSKLPYLRPYSYRLGIVRPAATGLCLTLRRTVGEAPMLKMAAERARKS